MFSTELMLTKPRLLLQGLHNLEEINTSSDLRMTDTFMLQIIKSDLVLQQKKKGQKCQSVSAPAYWEGAFWQHNINHKTFLRWNKTSFISSLEPWCKEEKGKESISLVSYRMISQQHSINYYHHKPTVNRKFKTWFIAMFPVYDLQSKCECILMPAKKIGHYVYMAKGGMKKKDFNNMQECNVNISGESVRIAIEAKMGTFSMF